ncbi:MAG: hypothetical protein D6705_15160 [Deltaproteobacteria bacterium]|nr:MAG: hypothetical protein D6705_15160 [Deltaproteobacteria bacterium]
MAVSPHLLVAATPVVDIDGTIFVQGGLFLLMVLVLRPTLFKPWLAAQEARERAIFGAQDEAAALEAKARELGEAYDHKVAEARERAMRERSKIQREEEARREAAIAAARQEAEAEMLETRLRLEKEAAEARKELEAKAGDLAKEIVERILGRAA